MTKLLTKTLERLDYFVALGFGSGLLPKAPGTWGTLAAIPIYLLLVPLGPAWYIPITLVLFIFGILLCGKVAADLKQKDPSIIVFDEVVGYLFTMTLIPPTWYWIILGFVLFRFFDILKPPPISTVDKHLTGGFGIMFDDMLAAIPACLILHLLVWCFP